MEKPHMLCVQQVCLLLKGWVVGFGVFFPLFKSRHNISAGRALGRLDQKQDLESFSGTVCLTPQQLHSR